ncbi:Pycsar system effector family protein [Streptomyces achromogenes]|uniref:Pycsar system effector family protein n=1 Tax=Streptomyces achromogenes TaxID=67255 RepID=UPI0033FF1904
MEEPEPQNVPLHVSTTTGAPPSGEDRMFVEVQRADTKATALSGVIGALLAITAGTALSTPLNSSRMLSVAMVLVGTLLGAALVSALMVLRPIFPKDDGLVWRGEFADGRSGSRHLSTSVPRSPANCHELPDREAALTTLARRKFRAIRVAVDLTVAAISVAGLVLLLTFLAA